MSPNETGASVDDHIWRQECFNEARAYFSLLLVICVFIICINFDVIFTMATNKMLRTKRNAFLLSLSISDFMSGLVAIPLHIASNCCSPVSETLILAQAICFRFIAISTMLNILMITIERYIGILYPIRYQFILTKTRTAILVTCTWATSISAALVSCSWLISVPAGDDDIPRREAQFEKAYFIFAFVAFFLLPLITMTVLYAKMFRAISKARRHASTAQIYLKKCDRSQSPLPRSPLEIRITRSRSVTVDSYDNRTHARDQQRKSPQSPVMARERSRSYSSYGAHRSPESHYLQVETMVTHCESGYPSSTIVTTTSPMLSRNSENRGNLGNGEVSSGQICPTHVQSLSETLYLTLPPNEATRYANYHGSYDRFVSPRKFTSKGALSNSTQSINGAKNAKPLVKYPSDDINVIRGRSERFSLADRLTDACESAASKLRMLRQGSNEERWGQARINREHRVLLVFVTMLSVFALSWISWYVVILDFTYSIHIPVLVHDSLDILRFFVSFINPILYTFFKNDFRSALLRRLRKFSSTDRTRCKHDSKEKVKM